MSGETISIKKRDPYLSGKMMTKGFEGWRDKLYKDTAGRSTIGYGFNMEEPGVFSQLPLDVQKGSRGITKAEADVIFDKIYDASLSSAKNYAGQDTWAKLSEGQKNVLTDMAYNLGAPGLSKFVKMRTFLQAGDYPNAAKEMKNSKWYGQVGQRAKNHYLQIQK